LHKELINIRVQSISASTIPISLWTKDFIVNATTKYLYNLSGVNYQDGNATITINSSNYTLKYDGTIQGLANAINNLNFGYFLVSGNTIYTQDDTNIYGNFTFPSFSVKLLFDNISNVPVANASSVSDWNTFFSLPTYGNPFTSVVLNGNEVQLIGGSNIEIKNNLFYDNLNILGVNDNGSIIKLDTFCFYGCYYLQYFIVQNLAIVGTGCFDSNISLTNINLPSLTTLGDYAFSYCDGITSIYLPKLTTLGVGVFSPCVNLVSINFPLLTTTSLDFFYQCTSLTTLVLPSLTTIGDSSFWGCTALQSINLPSVTYVDASALRYCTSLQNINLPNATFINLGAFQNCNLVSTINIGSCTNLGGTVANNNVFSGITGKTITLTIPASRMTCNAGNPDGDIQYLQSNNSVTIVTT